MKPLDLRNLLNEAAAEIRSLRRERDILAAQAGVIEVFRAALLGPPVRQGYGVDMAWRLEQEALKAMQEPAKPSPEDIVRDMMTVRADTDTNAGADPGT